MALYEKLEWKRLSEIYPEQKMYTDTFRLDDILQGALGDCYFLAGLASLTNQPERIASLLVTKEVNYTGIYQVQLFVNGLRTSIVVDDYVPVYKDS